MNKEKDKTRRLVLGAFLIMLLGFAGTTFYIMADSPNDENLFMNPPSPMYVQKSVPAARLSRLKPGEPALASSVSKDSLEAGDLLYAVNKDMPRSILEYEKVIRKIPPESSAVAYVFRGSEVGYASYRVSGRELKEDIVRSMPGFVYVIDIAPRGASERAGMRIADAIVRINGSACANATEADVQLRRAQSGRTINYEVIRGAQQLTLQVTLARFGIPIGRLMLFLTALAFMGFGSFVAFKRPSMRGALLVGLSFLMLGFGISILVIRREVDQTGFALIRNAIMLACVAFGLATWGEGRAYFPNEIRELTAKRWIFKTGYGVALLSLPVGFLAGEIPALVLLLLLALFLKGASIAYRKNCSPECRKMRRTLTIATLVPVPLIVLTAIPLGILRQAQLYGVVGLFLLLIPATYLYTIGRFRLFDIDLRVRRNTQYTLVSVAWTLIVLSTSLSTLVGLSTLAPHLPSIAFTGSSIEVDTAPAFGGSGGGRQVIILMFLAILSWIVFWKVRRWVQVSIDRKYYRTRYDYRRASSELSEMLATKLSMSTLAEGIVEKLSGLMHLKQAGVMFLNDGQICCRVVHGAQNNDWGDIAAAVNESLLVDLRTFTGPVRVEYLSDHNRQALQLHAIEQLVPIRSKDRLIGLLLLGEKLSEAGFNEEDFTFLSAAAGQFSISVENAFLYEEIAEKERLKLEMDIARRIQLESLPQLTPRTKRLDIVGSSVPALEVGGDFFDYLEGRKGELTVIVGDVSGKGTSAALYMSKVQGIFRSLHSFHLSPHDMFVRANRLLCADLERNSFVTAIGASIDASGRRVLLSRAGHLPLYRYSSAREAVQKVVPRGLGLGLNGNGVFAKELHVKTLRCRRGDVLLLVTDGITEAMNEAGEEFGENRLVVTLTECSSGTSGDIHDRILSTVRRFCGKTIQRDDQTVVVIKMV